MAGSQRSQPNAAGAYAAGAAPAAGAGAGQRRRSAVEPQLSPICRQLHSAARTRGRQPELRNAAPRYADVTGCSLPTDPGEAGWPALTVGWHAGCSPRTTLLVGRRVGRMCAVGVRLGMAVCMERSAAYRIGSNTLGSHLSPLDCRLSTLDSAAPNEPTRGASQQPAASSQRPAASPLICSRTPKMPHIVCGQRQGQTVRETFVLDYPWHMPAGQRSPSSCG
jgi:hypothetical protein